MVRTIFLCILVVFAHAYESETNECTLDASDRASCKDASALLQGRVNVHHDEGQQPEIAVDDIEPPTDDQGASEEEAVEPNIGMEEADFLVDEQPEIAIDDIEPPTDDQGASEEDAVEPNIGMEETGRSDSKGIRCDTSKNFILHQPGGYHQRVIRAPNLAAATNKCKAMCGNGCTGFFYQQHWNGHQICGFYKKPLTGRKVRHGHKEGAICAKGGPVKEGWNLAKQGESCEQACRKGGFVCDLHKLNTVTTSASVVAAAKEAGTHCHSGWGATVGWAYDFSPGVCTHPGCCGSGGRCRGICSYGNNGRRSCSRPGGHYSRLCPCSKAAKRWSELRGMCQDSRGRFYDQWEYHGVTAGWGRGGKVPLADCKNTCLKSPSCLGLQSNGIRCSLRVKEGGKIDEAGYELTWNGGSSRDPIVKARPQGNWKCLVKPR